MRLDEAQRDLLARARIGMLAIGAARPPLVSPAAFHFGGGALWMTTSRHAAKLSHARRDPRAAFLVAPGGSRGGHGVLIQGLLETYDPRSLAGQLRAAAQGPALPLNLAGYAIKNAAFIGGYLLDLARIPAEWWPQNRVLLRLRPDRVLLMTGLDPPAAASERVGGLPAQVAGAVARHRVGHLCWLAGGRPMLASAAWAMDGADALAWLPPGARPPRAEAHAALLVEHHHAYRATRMLGLCLRGRLRPSPGDPAPLDGRYAGSLPGEGTPLRLAVERITWWRGFDVRTDRVAAEIEVPHARVR